MNPEGLQNNKEELPMIEMPENFQAYYGFDNSMDSSGKRARWYTMEIHKDAGKLVKEKRIFEEGCLGRINFQIFINTLSKFY